MSLTIRIASYCVFIGALLTVAAPLHAFTISSDTPVNKTFDVTWELMGGSAENPIAADLSGSATFEYLGINDAGGTSQLLFGLTLNNTTVSNSGPGFSNLALTAFGFGTDANVAIASWGSTSSGGTNGSSNNGNVTTVASVNPNAPPPSGVPDFNDPGPAGSSPVECKDDPNNTNLDECITVVAVAADPNNPGIPSGASDNFELVLDLNQILSPTTPVTINPFAVSYGYTDPNGGPGEIQLTANQVPTPGTLLLLGLGAIALRLGRNRQ